MPGIYSTPSVNGSGLKRHVERAGVSLRRRRDAEDECGSALIVDAVVGVAVAPLSLDRIWCRCVHLVRERVVEEELRREVIARSRRGSRPHLEMNVHGAPAVPTGIDGGELRPAV